MKEITIKLSDKAYSELVDLEIELGFLDPKEREAKIAEYKERDKAQPLKALFG